MVVSGVLGLATATVAAGLVTASRVFGLRRLVKHATKTDVAFTVGMGVALSGTMGGMIIAIVAGLIMALTLSALKVVYGAAEKFRFSTIAYVLRKPQTAQAQAQAQARAAQTVEAVRDAVTGWWTVPAI